MQESDVIIVGGGPAGLSAGLYLARAKIPCLLIEKDCIGGQAATTDNIENYPGFPEGISGQELTDLFRQQAEKFGLRVISDSIKSVSLENERQVVQGDQDVYYSKALIAATGAFPKRLGVKGEMLFTGKGVSYCAICDADLYTGDTVMVIGGGDAALEEAIFLTEFADRVLIAVRRGEGELRATPVLQERAMSNPKIEFLYNSILDEICGKEIVNKARLYNKKSGEVRDVPVNGIFIFIGSVPSSDLFRSLVDLDHDGYILTNENMETSVRGIFAAGDVRKKPLRQVVTAVSDGAVAAISAQKYLHAK